MSIIYLIVPINCLVDYKLQLLSYISKEICLYTLNSIYFLILWDCFMFLNILIQMGTTFCMVVTWQLCSMIHMAMCCVCIYLVLMVREKCNLFLKKYISLSLYFEKNCLGFYGARLMRYFQGSMADISGLVFLILVYLFNHYCYL